MNNLIVILLASVLCIGTQVPVWAQGAILPESGQQTESEPNYIEQDMTGKVVEADMLQRKVLNYYEDKYGVNSVETLKFIEALAWMNMELQDFTTAGSYYLRAIDIRNHKMPVTAQNSKELAVAYFMLADSYLYREYYLEAETFYDKSLINTIDPAHQGDVYSRKGIIYEGTKEPEKAIKHYLNAVRNYELSKNRSPQNRQVINKRLLLVYAALEDLYAKTEQTEKAREYADLKMVTERLMGNTQQ